MRSLIDRFPLYGFLFLCAVSAVSLPGQLKATSDIFQSQGQSGAALASQETADAVKLPDMERTMHNAQVYEAKLIEINRIANKKTAFFRLDALLQETSEMAANLGIQLGKNSQTINLKYNRALLNYINKFDDRLKRAMSDLDTYSAQLGFARLELDSIMVDPLLYQRSGSEQLPPEQPAVITRLRENIAASSEMLNKRRLTVATYQSRGTILHSSLAEYRENLTLERRRMHRELLRKDSPLIWQADPPDVAAVGIQDVISETWSINKLILKRYLVEHGVLSIALLLAIILLYVRFRGMLRTVAGKKQQASVILSRAQYLPRRPLLSAIHAVVAVAPVFYPSAPTALLSALLFLLVLATGGMLYGRLTARVYQVWMLTFIIFAASTFSNMYWQVALSERWVLMALSASAAALSVWVIRRFKFGEHKLPEYLPVGAWIYLIFQVAALLAMALGRFNLGKILSLSATLGVQHAIALLVFVAVLKEAVYLQTESARDTEKQLTSYFDFEALQRRVSKLFFVLSAAIWLYFFLENLSVYDVAKEVFGDFMTKERTLLNAGFSIGDIVIFIGALYVSVVLANNVAFFLSLRDQQYADDRNKRIGSFTLLVKIGIISAGFIIAVAISGIPLDKLAIVLGALSVGIGFGLQGIVNNLVSGIILAFERPVQIGDSVSIGPVSGIVQSIGVRASKIKDWDGAEVIIPNGDVLSQTLTNWTLTDKRRRVELIIGVAYGSNIDLVSRLIAESLEHPGILKDRRAVYLQNFGDNSLDFRVLFWVRNFDAWVELRDTVMRSIAKAFAENGVQIPFPQRDLYIKEFPAVKQERVSGKDAAPLDGGEIAGRKGNENTDREEA